MKDEGSNPEEVVRRIIRKLRKNDGNLAKAALDLLVILENIKNPDLRTAVLLFDALERIRECVLKHLKKSSNTSPFQTAPQRRVWDAIKIPKLKGGGNVMERQLQKQRITNGVFAAYFEITKLIANKTRWRILARLTEKETLTWPEMQFDLGINPNMIRHHLRKLLDANLIEEANPGFRLTKAGKAVMTMSIKDMIRIANIGIGIATTKEKGG